MTPEVADDPTASGDSDIGRGLLEAEMGPSSTLAHLYRGEVHRMKMWRERLSHDYCNPRLKIFLEEVIAHRLRRVYLPLLAVAVAAWVFRVTAFADAPWPASAAVATISGLAVTGLVALVVVVTLVVTWRPREWHTRGELLETDVDARRELKWPDSDD